MATSPSTLEYVISIVFNQGQVRGATQAMDALEKKAQGNVDAMKKLGSGNKEIERSYSDATQKINGIMTPLVALTQKFRDNKGVVTETTRYYEKLNRGVGEIRPMVEATTNTIGKHTQSIGAAAAGFAKLALRAAVVVPIWMIIRTIFGTVQKLITDSIQTWIELSREMARVGSTGFEAAQNMNLLKGVVLDFSRNSSRGFKEVASAIYQLGSAGLSVTEMIQGLPHVMNLAIASFANTEQTAKLVAGAYNVFGEAMVGAFTISEKFKNISDILAYTYAKQQVELEDLSNAMSYVASAAGLMEIDFGDLVTTIGVLNSGMLKGSKAGVALMNAFIQIAQESSKLANLGVIFDPSKPLDFVNVVDQLHTKYGDAALSLNNLKEIMDVFGQRGGRAMAQLIADYDRWKNAIKDAKASYKDFAEIMRQVSEQSLPAAWEKMWNGMKANMIQSLSGFESVLTKLFSNVGADLMTGAFLKEFKKQLKPQEIEVFATGTREEKVALVDRLTPAKELWLMEKKILADIKIEELYKNKIKDTTKDLNEIIKDVVDNGGQEAEVQAAISKYVDDIYAGTDATVEVLKRMKKELIDIAKQKKIAAESALVFSPTELKSIRDIENATKYEKMRAGGAKDSAVAYAEISDLINNANIEIQKFNDFQDKNAKIEGEKVEKQKKYLDIQTVINSQTNEELLVLKGIGGEEEKALKIIEAKAALLTKINAQQMEYAMKLRSDMSSVFKDVLLGEDEVGNIGKRIGDSMRTNIAEALANSLSMGVLQTGLGEVFGNIGAGMENLFSGPGGMFTSAIVQGVKISSPTMTTTVVDAHTQGAAIVKKAIIEGHTEGAQAEEIKKGAVPPVPPTGGVGIITTGGITSATTPVGGGITAVTPTTTQVNVTPTEPTIITVDKTVTSDAFIALKQQQAQIEAAIAKTNEQLALTSISAEERSLKEQQENVKIFDNNITKPIGAFIDNVVKAIKEEQASRYVSPEDQKNAMIARQKEVADVLQNPENFPLADTSKLNTIFENMGDPNKINQVIASAVVPPTGPTLQEQLAAQLKTQQDELAKNAYLQQEAIRIGAQEGTEAGTKNVAKETAIGAEKGTQLGIAPVGNQLVDAFKSFFSGMGGGGAATGLGGGGATTAFGIANAAAPFFTTPVGGTQGLVPEIVNGKATGKYRTAAGKPAATYGDVFGGAVTGAMMGYSQYQSMTARGVSPGYAAASGGLMGIGGFMTSMGMASGMFPIAGVGMILMAAGYLMDVFKKGKATTTVSESTKVEQKQVTSRIDVTNKQLEVVNRNLVAMRDDLNYVMQSSYYFRERTMEDRYAIDSQRGNM